HVHLSSVYFFLFTALATTEIYTLSLHDALPIWSTYIMSSSSASTSSPNSASDDSDLLIDNESISHQSYNLPPFHLPSIPILSETDLNSRIPASIVPSTPSNVLLATPPVFLTLGF